ncbi:MAG: DUF192 domain-containing protein [Gammaproteobacteria bacterium]|nr:DUF192 domain-containing protein [Gammaproteobacteria bacterium]
MLAILCMTAQPVNLSAAEPAKQLIGFNRSQLLISTAKQQCILFDIYIASTHEQRSQGLMFINEMGTYEGMIFLYPQSVQISMWMKNTLIPLDMLFIGESGEIKAIHTDAVPLSTAVIGSGVSVNQVLELNAGSVRRFGIQINDTISLLHSPL